MLSRKPSNLPTNLLGMLRSRTVRRKAIGRRGFVLIAMCATLFLLMGMIGLAFDFGRVYVAHNEAQLYTDAAALTAASKLNGTDAGLAEARAAVATLPGRWNFGQDAVQGAIVEFSADGKRWITAPDRDLAAGALTMVRVSAPSRHVDMSFLRVTGSPSTMKVDAASVAATGPTRLVE